MRCFYPLLLVFLSFLVSSGARPLSSVLLRREPGQEGSTPPPPSTPGPSTQNRVGRPQYSNTLGVPRLDSRGSSASRSRPRGGNPTGVTKRSSTPAKSKIGPSRSQPRGPLPTVDWKKLELPELVKGKTLKGEYWLALWAIYTECSDLVARVRPQNEEPKHMMEVLDLVVRLRNQSVLALQTLNEHFVNHTPTDPQTSAQSPAVRKLSRKFSDTATAQRNIITTLESVRAGTLALTPQELQTKLSAKLHSVKSLDLGGLDPAILAEFA